jgi:hypothetical protein
MNILLEDFNAKIGRKDIFKPTEVRVCTKKNIGKKKWATFTFFGPETRTITKLFKNTEIGISYRTRNSIKHLLRIKENKGKYNQSGVYQLQCTDCP